MSVNFVGVVVRATLMSFGAILLSPKCHRTPRRRTQYSHLPNVFVKLCSSVAKMQRQASRLHFPLAQTINFA